MTGAAVVLVVAKAPVPGQAKTRLCPPATPEQAADIAAAALLDTLAAVRAVPGTVPVVALVGQLSRARRQAELRAVLRDCAVLPQRGPDFASRLAAAHADVAELHPGWPVLQIGMDTPQVTPALLAGGLRALAECDAVLGPAADGGWWALGLRDPRQASVLRAVPMSTARTGADTLAALRGRGLAVRSLPVLSDVDDLATAVAVARDLPDTRFAAAVHQVGHQVGHRDADQVAGSGSGAEGVVPVEAGR